MKEEKVILWVKDRLKKFVKSLQKGDFLVANK